MKSTIICIISLLVFLTSCKNELSPKDFIQFVNNPENGLVKTWEQGGVLLSCQFTPATYIVLKQHQPEDIATTDITSEVKTSEEMTQFKIKFSKKNSSNFLKTNQTTEEEFNLKTMYLSYDIRQDFKIVVDKDTSYCAMHHMKQFYFLSQFMNPRIQI